MMNVSSATPFHKAANPSMMAQNGKASAEAMPGNRHAYGHERKDAIPQNTKADAPKSAATGDGPGNRYAYGRNRDDTVAAPAAARTQPPVISVKSTTLSALPTVDVAPSSSNKPEAASNSSTPASESKQAKPAESRPAAASENPRSSGERPNAAEANGGQSASAKPSTPPPAQSNTAEAVAAYARSLEVSGDVDKPRKSEASLATVVETGRFDMQGDLERILEDVSNVAQSWNESRVDLGVGDSADKTARSDDAAGANGAARVSLQELAASAYQATGKIVLNSGETTRSAA